MRPFSLYLSPELLQVMVDVFVFQFAGLFAGHAAAKGVHKIFRVIMRQFLQ
jgi:hypothetical protein